jgi:hypothetical protein
MNLLFLLLVFDDGERLTGVVVDEVEPLAGVDFLVEHIEVIAEFVELIFCNRDLLCILVNLSALFFVPIHSPRYRRIRIKALRALP